MEGHGREFGSGFDLTRTVGWFTSIYPTRISLKGTAWGLSNAQARRDYVRGVSEQLRGIPRKGWAYPLLRGLDAQSAHSMAAYEDSQIIFNYLGGTRLSEAGAWQLAPETAMLGQREPSLALPYTLQTLVALHDGDGGTSLTTRFVASADLLSERDLSALASAWTHALADIAGLEAPASTAPAAQANAT